MVGTPGRLEDLISTGKLELSSCRFFVLDECVSFVFYVTLCLLVYDESQMLYKNAANFERICIV